VSIFRECWKGNPIPINRKSTSEGCFSCYSIQENPEFVTCGETLHADVRGIHVALLRRRVLMLPLGGKSEGNTFAANPLVNELGGLEWVRLNDKTGPHEVVQTA